MMGITSDSSLYAVLGISFVFGLWHALDADHLAAVSAIVSDRKSLLGSSLVGGLWGLGHTVSLFAVGILIVLLKSAELSTLERYEGFFEAGVGIVLVFLGLNVLRKVLSSERIHAHSHAHSGRQHMHIHAHATESAERSHHGLSPHSVFVGMMHGLAGSAGLMLLVVPTISSPTLALTYIAVFGIGSIGGMMVMSFLMGLPIYFTAGRFEFLNRGIRLAAGIFSFGLGAVIVYDKLVAYLPR
jgi:high-affinity nickel permease